MYYKIKFQFLSYKSLFLFPLTFSCYAVHGLDLFAFLFKLVLEVALINYHECHDISVWVTTGLYVVSNPAQDS